MMSSNSNQPNLHKEDNNGSIVKISNPEKLQVISSLKQFLLSCFGPRGRAKYVQNSHGALMTISASSQKLFSNLTFASPISQLVASSILQHLSVYSDNGLYMGIVISSIVEGAIKCDLHHKLCCEINNLLLNACLDAIKDISFKIDLSNLDAMLCLVRSIFRSKPSCCVSTVEINILSSLVLQTLFSSLPDNLPKNLFIPRVEYVTMVGYPATETKLINGVLLDVPSSFHKIVAAWKKELNIDHADIKVALFNNSLAIKRDPLPGVTLEVSVDVDIEGYASQQMEVLSSKLRQAGVNFVGCQKVIHPTLVKTLHQMGILTVDRLSLLHIGAVQNLTGACILSSMDCDITADSLGSLVDVTSQSVLDQEMLQLTSSQENQVTTVILCHRTEACLQELKHVFGVAYHVACLSLSNPEVVPGGGVFETCLVTILRGKLTELWEAARSELPCTLHQFNLTSGLFLRSLEGVAKGLRSGQPSSLSGSLEETRSSNFEDEDVDSTKSRLFNSQDSHRIGAIGERHRQSFPGKMSEEDETGDYFGMREDGGTNWDQKVVDLLITKKNALKMSVEMSNMILSIGAMVTSSE
ncbi:molecular chaperone MKKS-like [Apostichopus japonicus]|uniref:molecular chaperone MKKS-like n=1 Tax=Stichopus japonicus TaxID=307972 RepID=UPI003AB371B8